MTQETDTTESMVARLRSSKVAVDLRIYSSGREAGKEWAECFADFYQLNRLDQLLRQDNHELADIIRKRGAHWMSEDSAVDRTKRGIAEEVMDNADLEDSEVEEFWLEVVGLNHTFHESTHFLSGFAEGAAAAFREVKNQI